MYKLYVNDSIDMEYAYYLSLYIIKTKNVCIKSDYTW